MKLIKSIRICNREYICLQRLNEDYRGKVLIYKWINKEDYEYYVKLFDLLRKETI